MRHESQSEVSCLFNECRSRIRLTRMNHAPFDAPWPKASASSRPSRHAVHASKPREFARAVREFLDA